MVVVVVVMVVVVVVVAVIVVLIVPTAVIQYIFISCYIYTNLLLRNLEV
jgi:hypothetical protein